MQSDHGSAAFVMDNFKIVPIEFLPDTRAERLTDGFLAGKACSDTGGRVGLLLTILDLVRSKEFVQKFFQKVPFYQSILIILNYFLYQKYYI